LEWSPWNHGDTPKMNIDGKRRIANFGGKIGHRRLPR
jgi:hypothetical protein